MMAGKPITASFTDRSDLDQMPDTPNRRAHHRRAQSETIFRVPDIDDILLDNVVMTDFNLDLSDTPMVTLDSTAAATKSADSSSSGPAHSNPVPRPSPNPSGPTIPFRSLSIDSDIFNGLGLTYPGASLDCGDGSKPAAENKTVGRHRHSNSMDGSITSLFEVDSAKKAMAPDRLAELALIDPKRAKRILANRQSASRSKERKIRYTNELEKKVQTLQSEATSLSAQVTMLQRDTGGLTQENKELKLRLQAMEKETHLRDALNEALREELQRLKIASGQVPVLNGNNYNRAPPTQFPSQSQAPHFGNQQMQHSQQQQQLRMLHSTTKDKSPPGQQQLSFMDCNQMG